MGDADLMSAALCSMSAAIISGWSGPLTAIPSMNSLTCHLAVSGGRFAAGMMKFYIAALVALRNDDGPPGTMADETLDGGNFTMVLFRMPAFGSNLERLAALVKCEAHQFKH